MANTADKLPTNEQVARALGVSVQSTDVGGKVPTLSQLKKVMDGSGGGNVKTVTCTITSSRGGGWVYYTDGSDSFNRASPPESVQVSKNSFICIVADMGFTIFGATTESEPENVIGNTYFVIGDFSVNFS